MNYKNQTSETINKKIQKKISIHVPKKKSLNSLSNIEFGFYLAGLIEPNNITICKNKTIINIILNKKDISLAFLIKKKLGFGKIKKNNINLNIQLDNIKGILLFLELINNKLRTLNLVKNLQQFIIDQDININFNSDINHINNITNTYWLCGFIDNNSIFEIDINQKKVKHKFNYHKDLLNLFSFSSIFSMASNSCSYKEYDFIFNLIKYLEKFSLQSRKYLNYIYLRKIYIILQTEEIFTIKGKIKIDKLINKLNFLNL